LLVAVTTMLGVVLVGVLKALVIAVVVVHRRGAPEPRLLMTRSWGGRTAGSLRGRPSASASKDHAGVLSTG
jgi:hypothetical protein